MISWNIPSLKHPPKPKPPRLILWFFIMIIIGFVGFGIGVYLSSADLLSNTINNNQLIAAFVILPMIVSVFIRLLIYSLTLYRYELFTDMLDDAKNKWHYWAEKILGY